MPLRVSDFAATWIYLQHLRANVFLFKNYFYSMASHFLSIWQPVLILQGLTQFLPAIIITIFSRLFQAAHRHLSECSPLLEPLPHCCSYLLFWDRSSAALCHLLLAQTWNVMGIQVISKWFHIEAYYLKK